VVLGITDSEQHAAFGLERWRVEGMLAEVGMGTIDEANYPQMSQISADCVGMVGR